LGKARKAEINYVLNNTFGFGGHTASTIFKKNLTPNPSPKERGVATQNV
jgi:hypothetical protein